jgi:DNA-directed RNA polymerase II subunit RPB2
MVYERRLRITDETKIFQKAIKKVGLTNNIRNDFDATVLREIPSVVDNTTVTHSSGKIISFKNTYLQRQYPNKSPSEFRSKKELYMLEIRTSCAIRTGDPRRDEDVAYTEISLGLIPCMLGTKLCYLNDMTSRELFAVGECPYDQFGYFISKSEKVIIASEQLRLSSMLTYLHKGDAQTRITCPCSKGTMVMEIFQVPDKGTLMLKMPMFKYRPIECYTLFYLYGISPDDATEMILSFIDPKDARECIKVLLPSYILIRNTLREYNQATERDRRRAILDKIATDSERPHLSFDEYMRGMNADIFPQIQEKKMEHFAMMIAQHTRFLARKRPADNRDCWSNKRIILAGRQILKVFSLIWEKQKEEWMKMKEITISAITRPDLITSNFVNNMNPNRWGYSKQAVKENIVEPRRTTTMLEQHNQITRVKTPASHNMRAANPRMVDGNQLGLICAYETPEGEQIGLMKNVACLAIISLTRPTTEILNYFHNDLASHLSADRTDAFQYPVLINGILRFFTDDGIAIRKFLVDHRRFGRIPRDACVFWSQRDKQLQIYTDAERALHPMFVVNKETGRLYIHEIAENDPNIYDAPFEDILKTGCIDYVDAREQEFSVVAKRSDRFKFFPFEKAIKYDYAVIDPQDQFSIMSTTAPKANMQQCPRISYQAGMSRQSLGPHSLVIDERFDTSAVKQMRAPTRSYFEQETSEVMGTNDMPIGQSLSVAFFARKFNQEDGIEISLNTFKHRLQYWKYISFEARVWFVGGKGDNEILKIPEHSRFANGLYHAIDTVTNLPRIGEFIREKDCIIPKIRCDPDEKDTSIYAGVGENGYVERVSIEGGTGYIDIKVRLKKLRNYTLGAKMTAPYSQKGVVCKHTDPLTPEMPYIIDGPNHGSTVDILINSHSIPSRMTIGMLIEMIASKYAAQTGEIMNASAFKMLFEGEEINPDISVQEAINRQVYHKIGAKLRERGMNEHGLEKMGYFNDDGTVTEIENLISIGIIRYQCLRHHAEDKVQFRAENGNINPLTRQATSGRQKEGGLRFGEMERDSVVTHGSEALTLEKLCEASDQHRLVLCYKCGVFPTNNSDYSYRCKRCNGSDFRTTLAPYPMKLLVQVLAIAGIDMSFILN